MVWSGQRKSTLPPGWRKIRYAVLERDQWCCVWQETDGSICGLAANEVDHIGDKLDHSPENLRSLCRWHHARRTAKQGSDAANAKGRPTMKRPPEPHPGYLR